MRGVQYLPDGHHVDDAGNLISCAYVDLRDPAERGPITTLRKASPERYAIPGCGTIRLSKPTGLVGRGEGLAVGPAAGTATGVSGDADRAANPVAVDGGRNAWIYSASIEPETRAEQAAWREALPAGHDAVSPIRRPRAFARALGAMVAEQVGPQGRTLTLRSAVDGQVIRTAHRSQTVYHGAVVYVEDPYRRLESASSVLEFALLLLFMEPAAHRAQREYRFAVWAPDEPVRDRVDLQVSPALLDAMQNPPNAPAGGSFVPAGLGESSAVEEVDDHGPPRIQVHVEAPPGSMGTINPIIAPPRCDAERLPGDLRETAAIRAAAEALRAAVDQLDAESSRDAAAAAWRAESVVRFFCSTYGGAVTGVRVSEDSFVVIKAEVPGNELVEVTIAVGPDGTCACQVSTARGQVASASPDTRSLEQVLASRLAELGVRGRADAG